MSDTKLYTGKLSPIEPNDFEDIQDLCKRVLIEEEKYTDEKLEPITDYLDHLLFNIVGDKYVHLNNHLYQIFDYLKTETIEGYTNIQPNGDGTLSFTSCFHNGGTTLSDELEDSMDDQKRAYKVVNISRMEYEGLLKSKALLNRIQGKFK